MIDMVLVQFIVIRVANKYFCWLNLNGDGVNGVSTRKIGEITYELCGTEF